MGKEFPAFARNSKLAAGHKDQPPLPFSVFFFFFSELFDHNLKFYGLDGMRTDGFSDPALSSFVVLCWHYYFESSLWCGGDYRVLS